MKKDRQRFPRILGTKVGDQTFIDFHDRYPNGVSARLRHHIERDLDGRSPEEVLQRILALVAGPGRATAALRVGIGRIVDEYNNATILSKKG